MHRLCVKNFYSEIDLKRIEDSISEQMCQIQKDLEDGVQSEEKMKINKKLKLN